MIRNEKDIKNKLSEMTQSKKEISLNRLNDIIEKLPAEFYNIIKSAFNHKRIPKEYMLSSILFTASTSIGLTFYIETLGYKNYANLYFIIIGSRGDAKSEAMKIATNPIKELDDMDYNDYINELVSCKNEDSDQPKRKQTLIQNASIEAAHQTHSENPNSVGVSIDEAYSLIEKMGNSNSRDGVPWRTFLLEGYTNGHVDVSRKTTQSFRINTTYPTFLGGLQHQFVPKLFANGNLESGFIDRVLYTPKLTSNNKLSRGDISLEILSEYNSSISNLLAYKRQSENSEEKVKQFKIELSSDAEEVLFNYLQSLIERQNNAPAVEKEYMAKMQISIHKFCLLVYMMQQSRMKEFRTILQVENVNLAIDFNEFYFVNFQIILEENMSTLLKDPTIEQIIRLAKKNGASQKSVVEVTGLHKGTISRKWKNDKSNQQLATKGSLKKVR